MRCQLRSEASHCSLELFSCLIASDTLDLSISDLQDDAFFPELTVHETICFTSQLEGVARTEANAEATSLLRQMGLEGVAHRRVGERRIGTGARGISGGERRRLSVACAIAGESRSKAGPEFKTLPRAILADEPTTGLDAFQVLDVRVP